VTEDTNKLIARHFGVSESYISQQDYDMVAEFLIIWGLFEQTAFSGFLKYDELEAFSRRNSDRIGCNMDHCSRHFHDRYQDRDKYSNLRHGEDRPCIRDILDKPYSVLTSEDKLLLCMYVLYRFRNNIFHGNKGFVSWTQYDEEIRCCKMVMSFVIENGLKK
jgi:hypothetical protein